MKFPWRESTEAQKPATPVASSTTSSPKRSIEAQEPRDGERRIIPVPEDEKSNTRTSLKLPQAAEQGIAVTDHNRAAEKDSGTDLAHTASRATDASSVGEAGEDDESKYPKALPLAILTFGLCMSTFVVALDNTIIGKPAKPKPQLSQTDHMQQLLYPRSPPSSIP
jgi:hypothetical protein